MPSLSAALRSHGTASRVLFALAIPISALALGSLLTPVLCIVAALLALAAFAAWFHASPTCSRFPATILLGTGVGLTLFTTVQAAPLPASLVHFLSPATQEVWAGALGPLREPGPPWTSLSLEPIATRVQVLRGVTYLAAFLVSLRIAERRGGTRFLSGVIVLTAVALGTAAMLHPVFGAEKVFGLYKPQYSVLERHIAPLLNANHLAAYINVGFCLALGSALDLRAGRLRPIAIAMALLLVAIQFWVASRGGLVALAFAAVCIVLMARVSRRFTDLTRASLLLPGIVVAAGLGMIVLASSPDASSELSSFDASKIRLALAGLRLAAQHPLFGVGRGAFEVAFPATRTYGDYGHGINIVFTHPENIVVQWLTEWGIPVTVAGLVALCVALRPSVVLASSSPAIGAWAAIAATAVQNLVDFSSEVPAIGIALSACAAMLVAGRGSARRGWVHSWGARPRAVASIVAAAAVLSIAVVAAGWRHELEKDRTTLFEIVNEPKLRDDFAALAREALIRHPSEAYIPFIASVDASRRGRSVLPWIERTLTLAPVYGRAHFVLAQQLGARHAAQARFEYSLALAEDFSTLQIREKAIARGTLLVGGYDDALELIPSQSPSRLPILEQVAGNLAARLPATQARLDELIRRLDPNAQGPLHRIVDDATTDLESGDAAPWCEERSDCIRPGLAAVSRLIGMDPGKCTHFVSRARLGIAAEDSLGALRELEEEGQSASDPSECWRGLGELAFAARNDPYMEAAEEAMSRSGCASDSECATNLLWVASLEQRRGNPRRAMNHLQHAHDKSPDRADIVQRMAELAGALGMHAQAYEAYTTLTRMNPDPRWRDAANRERAELMHEATSQ
jgi:tetratricopeptide (TPR) repeat protein